VKVFGGNGQRLNAQDSISQSAPRRNAASTGRSDINVNHNGNNNQSGAKKGAVPPKKPKNKGRGVLIALAIILALVGGVYSYWHFTTKPPDTSVDADPVKDTTQTAGPQTSAQISNSELREAGRYYTVLVVGEDQIQSNTDTIMVARYDTVENTVNIVSIPRDTLVNISAGVKKINNIYCSSDGGIDALMKEVKNICGFTPDSYVVVNTNEFEKIIDTLGGVYFDVPVNMDYEDPTQNLNIHIKKGYQWLSGENALKVFRFRHTYAMGDIDRLNVQHDLIKACASQMLKLGNITKLYEAAKIVSDSTLTNLSYGNMQWYASEFMKMNMDNISIMTLPGNYSCSIRGVSYVSINVDEWLTMVNQYINPYIAPITAENCNILYQVAPDSSYTLNSSNYVVTNGAKVAGGLKSFYSS
jgi:polyisoprenyl-teichoic acid--peptidoglycan teichoic acid transferase